MLVSHPHGLALHQSAYTENEKVSERPSICKDLLPPVILSIVPLLDIRVELFYLRRGTLELIGRNKKLHLPKYL